MTVFSAMSVLQVKRPYIGAGANRKMQVLPWVVPTAVPMTAVAVVAAVVTVGGKMNDKPRDIPALLAMIEKRSAIAFAWRGGRDCVSFAARAVKAQTGIDPRGDLRWSTLKQARAAIAQEGGIEAALDARFDRIAPALARRGDIAGIADDRFGIRLMVVEGAMLVAPSAKGLDRLPRHHMIMAWDTESVRQAVSRG